MVSMFIDFLYLKEYNAINTEAVARSFPVKEVLLEILQETPTLESLFIKK